MQNFAPAGFDVEQLAQATPVGAGANWQWTLRCSLYFRRGGEE